MKETFIKSCEKIKKSGGKMKTYYAVPEYVVRNKLPDLESFLPKIHPKIAWKYDQTSTEKLAKALGFINFDTALPQPWVDDFKNQTGFDPVLNFVWCYDEESHCGYPEPITIEAEVAYEIFKHLEESRKC